MWHATDLSINCSREDLKIKEDSLDAEFSEQSLASSLQSAERQVVGYKSELTDESTQAYELSYDSTITSLHLKKERSETLKVFNCGCNLDDVNSVVICQILFRICL